MNPSIIIEQDHFAGWHAVIILEIPPDDAVLHVTDSYLTEQDARDVAERWINDNNRWPATA